MQPKAYKLGHQEFYGKKFLVDHRTYVPTQETEFLVDALLREIKNGEIVIDVGTGCGNIAVTIKLEKPDVKMFAGDISQDALEVARENSLITKADVAFFKSNYVDNNCLPSPDYIIANLPWGTPKTILHKGGKVELEHMPKVSLFHPEGPLGAQIALLKSILNRKWKPKVFLETGLLSKEQVSEIIPKELDWEYRKQGNYSITIINFRK